MVWGRVYKVVLFAAVLVLCAEPALAQTVGERLTGVRNSIFVSTMNLVGMVGMVLGLMLAASSIFKFKAHVDSPSNNPLSTPIKQFIAAGMLMSTKWLMQGIDVFLFKSAGIRAPKPSGMGGNVAIGNGLDGKVYQFIMDFSGPMIGLVNAFAVIGGLCLLIVAIKRLTDSADKGPRGPAGLGTLMTFLASGMLMSSGKSMGLFIGTLFGVNKLTNYAIIRGGGIDGASAARMQGVVESLLIFVMVVGYIAFIRGLFVLKAFGDGSGNASLAQALTFLIGGTCAVNLGEFINILGTTVGVKALAFG